MAQSTLRKKRIIKWTLVGSILLMIGALLVMKFFKDDIEDWQFIKGNDADVAIRPPVTYDGKPIE